MDLQKFKSFDVGRSLDVDEMVAGLAFGKALRAEYEALQMEEPEFLDRQLKAFRREILSKNADKVAARKRELAARIDALKSPTEKKKELEKELERLKEMEAASV